MKIHKLLNEKVKKNNIKKIPKKEKKNGIE